MKNKNSAINNRGFTLVELVVVMILISVLAVTAAPKLGNLSDDSDSPFYNMAIATIRSVQMQNMTNDSDDCFLAIIGKNTINSMKVENCKMSSSDSNFIIDESKYKAIRNRIDSNQTRFSDLNLKLDGQSIENNKYAIIGFNHLGNLKVCSQLALSEVVNKLGDLATCKLTIGTSYAIDLSASGMIK